MKLKSMTSVTKKIFFKEIFILEKNDGIHI